MLASLLWNRNYRTETDEIWIGADEKRFNDRYSDDERDVYKRISFSSYIWMLIGGTRRREIQMAFRVWDTWSRVPPFSNPPTCARLPAGINQPRKVCRKVLTSRRGAAPRVRERVKPAPLSRVPETPRGPRGDFLVLCLILADADGSCRSYDAGSRCGTTKEEDRGDRARGTVGPYRRSRMTRQANCVISVQRTPPRPRRRPSSCRPYAAHSSWHACLFPKWRICRSHRTRRDDRAWLRSRANLPDSAPEPPEVNFSG